MNQVMTIELARSDATDAGRRSRVRRNLPPIPWDREALWEATDEFNRLCRVFKLNPFVLPKSKK